MRPWAYVFKLIRFAFRENPLFYASVAISLVSVGIELLAMSSLFPLLQLISGAEPSPNAVVVRGLRFLGLAVSPLSLLWAFVALFGLRLVTQLLGQSISLYLGKRVLAQLGSRAFEQIVHSLSIREIHEQSIGYYIGLAGDESFRASTLVLSLTQFTNTVALAALYFAAIALTSPTTASLVLAFIVFSSAGLWRVLYVLRDLGSRQTLESRRAHSIFLDSLNNLKAVRAFSAESYVARLYRSILFGYTRILFWIDEIALLSRLGPVLLLLAVFALWLLFSGTSIEGTGVAFIVTTIVYLMRFLPTVGEAAHLLFKIVSDARSGRDVTAVLAAPAPPETRPLASGRVDAVELRGVGFAYDGDGKRVLSGVTLRFERGKSYALVGKSGVGKSTLAELLLKFYPPTEGVIRLNDQSVAEVRDPDVRKRVILVGSEAAIFDDTVANNVRLGMESSLGDVRAACQLARVSEFVKEMESGYETRLQYQGRNLSAGQRQRIAIARALLRKPDVLILDESTNALDKSTQEQLVEDILREYKDRIVVFITHDPAIMTRVDHVIDLSPGPAALEAVPPRPGDAPGAPPPPKG